MKGSLLSRFANPQAYAPLPKEIVNSDVAVGYVTGVECENIPGVALHHSYFSVVDRVLTPRVMNGAGHGTSKQTFVSSYTDPPTSMLTSIAVHPIKTLAEFSKFHEQIIGNLRPPMPVTHVRSSDGWNPSNVQFQALKKQYITESSSSCVANVADQICRYGEPLPPCHYGINLATKFPLTQVAVPTFHHDAVAKRLQPIIEGLGMQLQLVAASRGPTGTLRGSTISGGLKPGEVGYRLSMQRIMEDFLRRSKESVLFIADDDAMFHKTFAALYSQLDSYCFDGVATNGVLKLESSIWHDGSFPNTKGKYVGGWNLIDYEKNETHSQCYSGHYANVGSVATIYSRKSIPYVLAWLKEDETLPFDHVYNHLAKIGIPIRTAEPNLVIAKLDKNSEVHPGRSYVKTSTPHRGYAMHRWDVENFLE